MLVTAIFLDVVQTVDGSEPLDFSIAELAVGEALLLYLLQITI